MSTFHHTRLLRPEDEDLALECFERCRAYFEAIEGRSPERAVARELLTQLPPGKRPEEKQVFGFFDVQGVLIAFVDLVRDYPVEKEWIIGLFLIAPERRRSGLGRSIHQFIETHVADHGGDVLRVAVLEINEPGCRFWQGLGYYEVKRVPYPRGEEETIAIVMNRRVVAPR
jgi:GNAT superfamily N-acetyltransferase